MLRNVHYGASQQDGVPPDDVLPEPAVATAIPTWVSTSEHWTPHVDPPAATHQTKADVDPSLTVLSHDYSRTHASRAISHPSSRTTTLAVSPAQAEAAARDVCIVQTARWTRPASTKRAKVSLATATATRRTESSDAQHREDVVHPPLQRGEQGLSASASRRHPAHTRAATSANHAGVSVLETPPQFHQGAQAVPPPPLGYHARNKGRRIVRSALTVSAIHVKTETTSPPSIKLLASSSKNVRADCGEQSASAPGPVRRKRTARDTRSPAASSSRRVVPKLERPSHLSLPVSMSTESASLPLFRASRNEEKKATQSTKRVHYFETCPLVDSFAERSVTCKACRRTIRLDGDYLPGKWWAHLRRDESCIATRVVMVECGQLPESVLALKDVRGRKRISVKTRIAPKAASHASTAAPQPNRK